MTATSRLDPPACADGPPLLRPARNFVGWIRLMLRPPKRVAAQPLWPLTPNIAFGILIAVAALVVTMFFIDARAITDARALSPRVIAFFRDITNYGKGGWTLWPLGVLLLGLAAFTARPLSRIAYLTITALFLRLAFLFFAIAVPGLTTDLLKGIGRARPFVTGAANPFAYSWFDWRAAYESFPSGHSTSAFAAAMAFTTLWPRWSPLFWAYAGIIGLSRVVITAHHPSDVVAGALVGVLGVIMVRQWFAARRLVFVVGPDLAVYPMPGPSWRRLKAVARGLFAQ
jgi:membrane-associated phospholipid phosphatase